MRGATCVSVESSIVLSISIHAPHAGSDAEQIAALKVQLAISIHAPYAERDGGICVQSK